MEGLCQSMLSRGASAASVSELRPFFSGFSGRFPLCDFSDVGPSKGRAAEKIRGVLDFHLQVHACKHIILGLGLGSDTTEHFATFDMNVHCLHRMTMLRNTSAPLSEADIEQLGPLRTTQFNTVFIDPATHFRNGKTQEPSYSVKTGEVTSYAEAASHALSLPQVFTNTAAAAPREPKPVPLAAGAALAAITTIGIKTATGTQTYRNSQAHPERLGPPLYNKRGKRVDRLLSVNKEALDWVRKGNLCPYLFLRGECKEVGGPKCRKQHSCRPLDDKEWNALWLVTRTKECRAAESRDGVCRNPTCVFGHHERD
ncbi:hypothetical protein EJ05DRAFT_475366 [Pseudovirgaria hyperparasitica]|uniref:DUF7923 domain-containing protein n=1 Tax=Pseudovirgaria hyperparasitica TaxID=470096 RepID=A0A6A6WC40_9PEZI|nr:uncharacterized protein EJ05DRAFT_475366 [Pseudovirgaria hyperparasitica]KAF2759137.1 hypothetical protein EJ05DRAFT_475366 [Pseudovirgaria hyperparasitica]